MATNPILAELNGLSPGAKQALQQAHGQATTMASLAPPPHLITDPSSAQLPPAMGAQSHPMAASAPPPIPTSIAPPGPIPHPLAAAPSAAPIQPPRGTVQFDQNERNNLLAQGSGIHQIQNPFLRGLAETGNVIGHLAAPGLMAAIPGTAEHHQNLLAENARNLSTDQGLLNNQVANEEKQAQIGEANARTANLENPPDTVSPLTTDSGIYGFHTKGGAVTPLEDQSGQQLQAPDKQFNQTPEEMAFQGAIKGGMAPLDAYRAIKDAGNVKDPSLQQQYLDALASGDTKKMQAIAATIRATSTQPKIDIREAGAGAANAKTADAETNKERSTAQKQLQTDFSTAQTQFESIGEAQSLINSGAVGQALGVVKTMVGLAGGKGSGVRITQAELNSLAQARGIQGNFEGWLNKLSGKGNLAPEQLRQINAVLSDAQAKLQQKRQALSDTLDGLDNATSPQEIRQIQEGYRHQLLGNAPAAQPGSGKTFDAQKWAAANPKGDVKAATAQAKQQGYQVINGQ